MKNYKDYRYDGITKTLEGDHIGYALFKNGHINEDLSEVESENIWCCLNKEPMIDFAKLYYKNGEFFIKKIHYSKYCNYLSDYTEFFSI